MCSNIIAHHGIKGMKWGVRRFQKKDGSLTSVGKKRRKDTKKNKDKNVTVKLAKTAVKRTAFAIGTAAVGSVATKTLSDKGKTEAASLIYALSRDTFSLAVSSAKINAGAAALSAMMVTGPNYVKSHIVGAHNNRKKSKK